MKSSDSENDSLDFCPRRRAIDLIMPPLDDKTEKRVSIHDYDPQWLISDIESGRRTGCLKASNDNEKQRGMILLNAGRVVGCIYSSVIPVPTVGLEDELKLFLRLLKNSDTRVALYDLPSEIVISISSLFLGYPIQRDDDYTSQEYFDYLVGWLSSEKSISTVGISDPDSQGMLLVYFFDGDFIGSYCVEDTKFNSDRQYIEEVLAKAPNSLLQISLLPISGALPESEFGVSMSDFWGMI